MVRVIPGVEVNIVKEIVPQQLYPAGVVGMIGTANDGRYRDSCHCYKL